MVERQTPVYGSSPRMRGALRSMSAEVASPRIIPAYAGSTLAAPSMPVMSGDHPRVCGEHSSTVFLISPCWGSSPRMRGAPNRSFALANLGGDHPRVCGEHDGKYSAPVEFEGSSPRMRGARSAVLRDQLRAGIIPAYAGSTSDGHARRRLRGDHPRVCGEHSFQHSRLPSCLGSSPRMRGAHRLSIAVFVLLRIIPAYAGSTKLSAGGQAVSEDHPRVCGEHSMTLHGALA